MALSLEHKIMLFWGIHLFCSVIVVCSGNVVFLKWDESICWRFRALATLPSLDEFLTAPSETPCLSLSFCLACSLKGSFNSHTSNLGRCGPLKVSPGEHNYPGRHVNAVSSFWVTWEWNGERMKQGQSVNINRCNHFIIPQRKNPTYFSLNCTRLWWLFSLSDLHATTVNPETQF